MGDVGAAFCTCDNYRNYRILQAAADSSETSSTVDRAFSRNLFPTSTVICVDEETLSWFATHAADVYYAGAARLALSKRLFRIIGAARSFHGKGIVIPTWCVFKYEPTSLYSQSASRSRFPPVT